MVRILGCDAASVSVASRTLREGGLVAFPTDTVYGLGCHPWKDGPVGRLFEAKGRDGKPVPVLFHDLAKVQEVVELQGKALELASKFWPGALTLVAPLKRKVPVKLDQGTGWLGVRIPDNALALALAAEAGGWVTGTSANVSGQPSCRTAEEVVRSLGDKIDVVIDGGTTEGTESTVVKVVGDSVEVLRRGAIGVETGITRESFSR